MLRWPPVIPKASAAAVIPLGARSFAVIDTLYAMTSDRPYRKALSFDTAKREILCLSGTQFDPGPTRAFLAEEDLAGDGGLKYQTPPFGGQERQD